MKKKEKKRGMNDGEDTACKSKREERRKKERRGVRAKRMTAIRPIIGWHQKCWVWLACQMGNSRRTAEGSYSRSWNYGPTNSVCGTFSLYLLLSLALWLRYELAEYRGRPYHVNGNHQDIISPSTIR